MGFNKIMELDISVSADLLPRNPQFFFMENSDLTWQATGGRRGDVS